MSNPTVVTVTRNGSNSYTAQYTNGTSKNFTSMGINVTFKAGNGTYYYSVNNGSTKTALSNKSNFTVSCGSLTYSNVGGKYQAKLYVYGTQVSVSGTNYYPQTTITIQRTGSSSYTYSVVDITVDPAKTIQTGGEVTGTTSEAALAMWSAGRVEASKYEFFWFGPMRGRLDPWKSGNTPSYNNSETRKHYDIGYAPYGMWGVQDNNNGSKGAATVARCIREYDNASTSTVSE